MKENVTAAADIFNNFLKTRNLSSTAQRSLILKEVFGNHSHFDAEDIVYNLKKKRKGVSRATIYRTLVHLEECGLIRKIDLGHGHAHYEHTHGHKHHEHLYCQSCGKIIEIVDATLEKRIEACAQNQNFTVTSHTVQIFGICSDCIK